MHSWVLSADRPLPLTHVYPCSDPNEKAHFWLSRLADEEPTAAELLDSDVNDRLYFLKNEAVRVRVEDDEFHDDEPGPPMAVDGVYTKAKAKRPPYEITASMACAGLGLVVWWDPQAPQDEG